MSLDPTDAEDIESVRAALRAKAAVVRDRGFGHAAAILFITLILFWTQQQSIAGQTGTWIAALVVVVLVHEAGHALAMRAFGYRDLKVFFIPFFGAAASGTKHDASAAQRAVVSLMGPLPGLLFALVATWFAPLDSEFLSHVAGLALFLNAFNLLPIMPLDGGRYLDVTVFARWPVMRQIVGHLSGLAIAWIGWQLDAWLLLGFGVLTFVTAAGKRSLGFAGAQLRAQLEPGEAPPAPFPERLVPAGMELANQLVFSKSSLQATPDRYANYINNAWAQAGYAPPTIGMTLCLLGAYAASVALVVGIVMRLGILGL